jgi:hypothetical protein
VRPVRWLVQSKQVAPGPAKRQCLLSPPFEERLPILQALPPALLRHVCWVLLQFPESGREGVTVCLNL